jgi:hypothetical protein
MPSRPSDYQSAGGRKSRRSVFTSCTRSTVAKRKPLPTLTPRAREIVTLVVNTLALGTHDDEGEVGAIAKTLGTTPKRLQSMLRKLEEQGWLTARNDFVYPTVAALQWQNPDLDERAAKKLLRSLK